MRETTTDLAIIGGGPAGLAAAIAAAEAGVQKILLLDRQEEPGGILPQCIHNGFGLRYFKEELTGPEYAARFIAMLQKHPRITMKLGTMVIELRSDSEGGHLIFTVNPADGMVMYCAKAVISAMGCRERPRGAVNIPGTRPGGVYTAGTVQRLMNIEGYRPGNCAVILGSGDIGLIMARRMTLEGIRIPAVVELLPYSSGLTRNLVQCLDDYGIPLYLSHTVTKIIGPKRVEAVEIAPVDTDRQPILEKTFTIECDTLVLSVGLIPENELSLMAGVRLDPATGGPVVGPDYQTDVPGIFACGNVVHVHDLADDVSAEGWIAGAAAAGYIAGNHDIPEKLTVRAGRNIRSVVPQQIFRGQPSTLYIRAGFPEKNIQLCVAASKIKYRAVTPGETIRYALKPDDIGNFKDSLPVSIEQY